MKKTIKILAIIASLMLVLVLLTGCGNNTTNNVGTSAKEQISRGVIDPNNVYTSEYADITFKLPEGWVYSTDEQIAALMNVGVESLSEDGDRLAKILEQTALYDMVANDQTKGTSVMVMFEKALLNVNEEYYLNNVKKGLETSGMGYEFSSEIITETVGGNEYKVLTATVPTYNMVQKYYVVKKGDYFVDILVTYVEGLEDINNILVNFQ